MVAPHLQDMQAREAFVGAKEQAKSANIDCRFVYRRNRRGAVYKVWQHIEPSDTIVAASQAKALWGVIPDTIRYERTPQGEVIHFLKEWSQKELTQKAS